MKIFTIILIVFFAVVSLVHATSVGVDRDGGKCSGSNEVWNDCGGCFEKICGVGEPRGIACAAVCRPRCECAPGFIRQSANGPCIPEQKCKPGPRPTIKPCGDNEEYTDCGTYCEPTCANRNPGPCPDVCVAGCFCKTNYIRERKNGTCICIDECKKKC